MQRMAGVYKLGAKYNTEDPGIWHQFALGISVLIVLWWKRKSNGKEMLHLCGRCKGASQHWAIVTPDQEVMIRISSWAYPGAFGTCRFHKTEDNQWGVERSPVSVYSWSAPDLQWYLTQCSLAFKIKWGLFAVRFCFHCEGKEWVQFADVCVRHCSLQCLLCSITWYSNAASVGTDPISLSCPLGYSADVLLSWFASVIIGLEVNWNAALNVKFH